MSATKAPLAALAFVAIALTARPAGAFPDFRDWLKAYVAERYDVPAEHVTIHRGLCHDGSSTSEAFEDRPFAHALRDETGGVELDRMHSRELVESAFAAIDAKGRDSDCDGHPDLVEIAANFDPNEPSSHPASDPTAAPCPEPPPAPGDDDDDNGVGPSGSGGASPPKAPDRGACSLSSPARPLDPGSLALAALVALSLARRARPRA